MAQSGCLACHKIGENGNGGPGPDLTDIADKLPKAAILRTLENPTAPMPSFAGLPEEKKTAMVDFLAQLRGEDAARRVWAVAEARTGTLEEGQVRAMFDRIARVYDLMNSVMTAGLHHRWRERAADLAAVGPGDRALDVATGTGDLAIELARRVGPGGRGDRLGLLRGDARRSPARRRRGRAGSGRNALDAAVPGRRLRRRHGRLRRAQLPRPRPRAGRDGPRGAARAGASSCSRSPCRSGRRSRRSSRSGSTASCPPLGRIAGDPDAYDVPAELGQALPGAGGARRRGWPPPG